MDKEMIIRTIVMALALLNQILVMFGASPLPYTNEEIGEGLTAVFTVGATLWAYWKNNSFTKEAKEADNLLKKKKQQKKANK